MKKILVTGGTGFIGRAVIDELLRRKYQVHLLTHKTTPQNISSNLKTFKGDILDTSSIERALAGCDAVIHLAVIKNGPEAYSVNVEGAQNLIEACKKTKVERVINISTQSTKIKSKGTYAQTKYQADQLFKKSGLKVTTLLISTILASDKDSLFGQINTFIQKLPVIPVLGSGEWRSFPIYIDDLSGIICDCIENVKTEGKSYDVGGLEEVNFNQLINYLQKMNGTNKRILHIPFKLSWLIAKFGELILPNPPITTNNVLGSNQDTNCKPAELLKLLNKKPQSLKNSLKSMFNQGDVVRVGLIGLGKMGMVHASLLQVVPNADLVAVCDQDKALQNTAKSMGLKTHFYSTVASMLDREVLDAVFICTPTFTHPKLVEEVILNNLDVFVEKPLTTTVGDTDKLVKLTQGRPDLITGVGFFYPFWRRYQILANLIEKGRLGNILDVNITVRHSEVLKKKQGWLFNKKLSGGGVVMNPTAHILLWLEHTFGHPQKIKSSLASIYSEGIEDAAVIELKYKNAKVKIDTSWSEPGYPILSTEVVVSGERGRAILNNQGVSLEVGKKREFFTDNDIPVDSVIDINPKAGGESYYFEDREFIQAVLNKKPYPIDFNLSKQVEETIDLIYQNA